MVDFLATASLVRTYVYPKEAIRGVYEAGPTGRSARENRRPRSTATN